MKTILVVDDEPKIADLARDYRIAPGNDHRLAGLDEAGRDAGVVRGHADADGAADEDDGEQDASERSTVHGLLSPCASWVRMS